jgi:uncharacterized protein
LFGDPCFKKGNIVILKKIYQKNLINKGEIKRWVIENCQYEVRFGSFAYGVADDDSDIDIVGFTIPPKEIIFPHLSGVIYGFGYQGEKFNQWQMHHIMDDNKKEYDISIFSIIKFFSLCMDNNPDKIDTLFIPRSCITHITHVGNLVRENRKIFLHKGSWHRFRGYAFQQMSKMKNKNPVGKRKELIEKYGYDTKFAYHVVRLLNEAEQILENGDLDLRRDKEQLKSIKKGDSSLKEIQEYFDHKEKILEKLYHESKLPKSPDESKIKELLLNCLEHHYGSLNKVVNKNININSILDDLEKISRKYR